MDDRTEKKTEGPKRRFGRAVAAAVTVLLAVLGLLAYIYRDYLTEEGLRALFAGEAAPSASDEAFGYESGARQAFAAAGDGLAVASSTGLQLLDADGRTVARQVFSMETPGTAASAVHAAFFDLGGTALRVADFKGNCAVLDTEEAIVSVTMNGSGWLAVCTEELGYKGLVTVYSAALEPVYRWHAGSGYLLKAEVSPDNARMAALCADAQGGVLRFFSLSSEEEQGLFRTPDELLFDFAWGGDGVCALSETAAYFTDGTGGGAVSYGYGGLYVTDYGLTGGDFIALYLGKYRGGGGGTLVTLDFNGEALGSLEVQGDVTGLSLRGKELLALGPDGLVLYSDRLESKAAADTLGVRCALFRAKGDALLISSYAAEVYGF